MISAWICSERPSDFHTKWFAAYWKYLLRFTCVLEVHTVQWRSRQGSVSDVALLFCCYYYFVTAIPVSLPAAFCCARMNDCALARGVGLWWGPGQGARASGSPRRALPCHWPRWMSSSVAVCHWLSATGVSLRAGAFTCYLQLMDSKCQVQMAWNKD